MTPLRIFFADQGFALQSAALAATAIEALLVLCVAYIADRVTKRVVVRLVTDFLQKTSAEWDDALLRHRVVHRLSRLAPAIVIYLLALPVFGDYVAFGLLVRQVTLIYMVMVIVFVIDAGLNAAIDILRASPLSKEIPVKSFVQVLKLVIYGLAAIAVLSLVLGRSPVLLFSGLGAMTAVLMLVFKDPLLGFIAGIQLSANRMVARGDWIEMPKYGADGDVLEVALTTVKIQNWDKTITTIPTYALITDAFKNWRGMTESGGRRIKRAINIDMQSIKFCDDDMLARFVKIQHVAEYMERKRNEIASWNAERGVDASTPVNGRRLTNVGTFRAYVVAYLNSHPMIDANMTFLVRQLAPTPHGLPIEIYVFSRDQDWVRYEDIQSDIFDHILAVSSEFDLRVYQTPSGGDLQALRGHV